MPETQGAADQWVRVDDAQKYQRGGILPMAAFLTKNASGLRTSLVKARLLQDSSASSWASTFPRPRPMSRHPGG